MCGAMAEVVEALDLGSKMLGCEGWSRYRLSKKK